MIMNRKEIFKNSVGLWLGGLLIVMTCMGCMTTTGNAKASSPKQGIMDAYLTKIQKYDGIDEAEAILLAQSQLIFRGVDRKYYIEHPEIFGGGDKIWEVKFFPVNKTLAQASANQPLVIAVNKKDGNVRWQP